MWADLPGLNADRADLDLLDVTIGTYQDASDEITEKALDGDELIRATDRDPYVGRARNGRNQIAYDLGHAPGGVYLPLDNKDFLDNTFVLPMRLEFKYDKPASMTDADWNALRVATWIWSASACWRRTAKPSPLTLPEDADAKDYFSIPRGRERHRYGLCGRQPGHRGRQA